MRNPLQDQLLKAGLVKKSRVAEVVREKARQRDGKAPPPPSEEQLNAERVMTERAERDRALAAERNSHARQHEQHAQARQIVDMHKIARGGELTYRFADGDVIRNVLVNELLRSQLASGAMVIVRHLNGYEVLPRLAADKVHARDPGLIVVDHSLTESATSASTDEEYYRQFKVPDDLVW